MEPEYLVSPLPWSIEHSVHGDAVIKDRDGNEVAGGPPDNPWEVSTADLEFIHRLAHAEYRRRLEEEARQMKGRRIMQAGSKQHWKPVVAPEPPAK